MPTFTAVDFTTQINWVVRSNDAQNEYLDKYLALVKAKDNIHVKTFRKNVNVNQ